MIHIMFYQYPASQQNMHLAKPGANSCDHGFVVQSGCEAAVQVFANETSKIPGRSLQVGSGGTCGRSGWGQIPLGCSVQSGGDWTAHYKTDTDTGAGCIHENYQLVCYGMLNFLIVRVFFNLSSDVLRIFVFTNSTGIMITGFVMSSPITARLYRAS